MVTGRFQLLPPLSAEEYEALKANVAAVGILQPVIVDEAGEIIDGHHRAQVCEELGIEYPMKVLDELTEDQKYEQAVVLNLGRRHLNSDQKRDLVLRLAGSGRTVRWIAKATGISKSSVHRYLTPAVPDGTTLEEYERVIVAGGERIRSAMLATDTIAEDDAKWLRHASVAEILNLFGEVILAFAPVRDSVVRRHVLGDVLLRNEGPTMARACLGELLDRANGEVIA